MNGRPVRAERPAHFAVRSVATLVLGVAAVSLASVACAQHALEVHRVEVFANSSVHLTRTDGATVYYVDGLQMLEAELSQGLPPHESEAVVLAQARMKAMGGSLQARARNAAQGIALASQYGVDRVPAVVVNRAAIIYGVSDVVEAVRLYRRADGQTLGALPGAKQ